MALWIKACGDVVKVDPKQGNMFTLEELQGFVGGHIELVLNREVALQSVMFCNEEGRLKGLPLNVTASMIWHQDIMGDVILVDSNQVD